MGTSGVLPTSTVARLALAAPVACPGCSVVNIPVMPGACGSQDHPGYGAAGPGAASGTVLCCHRMDVFFQAIAAPFLTLFACAKQPSRG